MKRGPSQSQVGPFHPVLVSVLMTALVLVLLVSYVANGIATDQRIYWSASYYASRSALDFPANVASSWDLKPIGHRAVNFLVFKAAETAVGLDDRPRLVYAALAVWEAIALAMLAAAAALSSRVLRERFGVSPYIAFCTLCLLFFATGFTHSLEAENMAVLVVFLAVGLSLRSSWLANAASGALIASLFWLKGITLLPGLIVYVVLLALGREFRGNLVRTLSATAVFSIAFAAYVLLRFPQEYLNLVEAAWFQGATASLAQNVVDSLVKFPLAFVTNPGIAAGLMASVAVFVDPSIWHEEGLGQSRRYAIMLAVVWMLALAVAAGQGRGLTYHYDLMLVAAALALLICHEFARGAADLAAARMLVLAFPVLVLPAFRFKAVYHYWTTYSPATTPALAVIVVLALSWTILGESRKRWPVWCLVASLAVWIGYVSPLSQTWRMHRRTEDRLYATFRDLDARFGVSSHPSTLFLADGAPNFYFSTGTYLYYYHPAPVQRTAGVVERAARWQKSYDETYARLLSYNGKYVVLDRTWFGLQRFPAIETRLENDYVQLANVDYIAGRTIELWGRK